MRKNPNLGLVIINAYTKFAKILSICSQAIDTGGHQRNYREIA